MQLVLHTWFILTQRIINHLCFNIFIKPPVGRTISKLSKQPIKYNYMQYSQPNFRNKLFSCRKNYLSYLASHSAPERPGTYIEANRSQLTLGKNDLIVSGAISRSLIDAIILSKSFESPADPSTSLLSKTCQSIYSWEYILHQRRKK